MIETLLAFPLRKEMQFVIPHPYEKKYKMDNNTFNSNLDLEKMESVRIEYL